MALKIQPYCQSFFNNPIAIGLFKIIIVWLLLFYVTSCTTPEIQSTGGISEKVFLNPSKEHRPLALWTWLNGYVDTTQLVYELEQMKSKGMRGALIWDLGALVDPEKLIPAGPSILGEESLKYFSLALSTSKKLDLDLGWVAASSWNAGGEWVEKAPFIGEKQCRKYWMSWQSRWILR